MSKHLGNVVDPDELVERYGADTVRLAVLYAAGPAKTLNWNDGAIRFARRFLLGVWDYSQERFAAVARTPADAEAAADTEFLRERLRKWCENGLERITADLENLQMHKAVRNVTRLFERIQDFEKRVVQRRGALCREDAEAQVAALVLLAQALAPFAPHAAEGLLIAAGHEDGPGLPGPWPEAAAAFDAVEPKPLPADKMSNFTAQDFTNARRPFKLIGRISLWPRGCRQIRGGPSLRAPALARRNSSAATAATAARSPRRPSGARAATRASTSTTTMSWPGRDWRSWRPSDRPLNIWRFEELLPIIDRSAQARVGQFSGQTPLIRAERLGAELGLANLYLKDDSTNRPSLSYKDRVVGDRRRPRAGAGQRPRSAAYRPATSAPPPPSLAAKAGLKPYVFYPANLERAKARSCRALGAQVCQLNGTYDEANRACRELAEASGIQFANITLRPFYAEGAKTLAFEIVEQLGWRSPEHIVMPAAGGTLSSRVHKGLNELEIVGLAETTQTKLHVGQPTGCSPIATAILAQSEQIVPQRPETLAHSLAIGAPGDGPLVLDAVRSRGGSAAAVADGEIITAMELLAATEGVLTEPAGGTTLAATMKLAERGVLDPEDTVVVVISGNGLKTLGRAADQALAGDGPLRCRRDGGSSDGVPPRRRRRGELS